MPHSVLSKSKSLVTYAALLNRVRQTLVLGQQRIETEKVRVYWETGQLIHAHVKHHEERAEYGSEVVRRLANDLGVDHSVLNRCVQFARTYQRSRIYARGHKFSWSHYRKLITVADDRKREILERKLVNSTWSAEELAVRINDLIPDHRLPAAEEKAKPQKPLAPVRGRLYTYKLTERPTLGADKAERKLLLDLGFGIFRDVDAGAQSRFSADMIVESRPKEDAYAFHESGRTAKDLYTYGAYIEKVIDGDTLKARIDLGFETWTRQVLRLRDIDCPEMSTREGVSAKTFVQSLLKEASFIVLRSSRSDKYDRYLADIFIPAGEEPDPGSDVFLNNVLLEKGLARRV